MANDLNLQGLWVPIVTPFTEAGDVDLSSLRRLAERLLNDGARGLVALGTTGEPATLTLEERQRVVEVCNIAAAQSGCPLIVGAGTNSTVETIDEIQRLTGHGQVAGALVVVPYYTRPSAAAVVEHFHLVADESPVPIVLYNIPYRTGRGLDSQALLDASSHPNIIGLKQSVGSLDYDTLDVLARHDPAFAVLTGDDAFIAPTVLLGGSGAIAAAAHICTSLFVELVEAALAGNVSRTKALADALLPVVSAGFAEPNPAVWKAALHHNGEISSATLRRPMTSASPDSTNRLVEAATGAHELINC